ncbi:hypothetical protein SNE40_006210 [Patella caerulea]|uniref:TFIID subunit TAF5 NTD2 domain-containing protein n=1 Tax=Patella caerulea TaxID=87958 RepID=A0AAN8K1V6_PATCE
MCDVLSNYWTENTGIMKRLQREEIMSSVHQYLKRRKFETASSDNGDDKTSVKNKRVCKQEENLCELSIRRHVKCSSITENVLSYSSISGDVTACDQQFTRLKNFLLEAVEPYRDELKKLLYPMYVHVYLEMLCNGHKTPAHKFYDRHVALFKDDEVHKTVIKTLRKLEAKSDVPGCKDIANFREHKFSITMSEESLSYLMRHLKTEDNMIMLQIFNHYLQVIVPTSGSQIELREPDKKEDKKEEGCSQVSGDVTLTSLKQCIAKVHDGPSNISSICCFTFLNTSSGLCSVSISADNEYICGGFEDSTISLWSNKPDLLHTQPMSNNPSVISVAADYYTISAEDSTTNRKKDVETLKMRGHNGAVYKTCFTHDSQYLLSSSQDTTVRLWDMTSHSNVVLYRGHSSSVWSLDISPLGYFASCSQDRTAKLWCLDRNYPIRSFVGHTYDVDVVKFHPNGNYIATGSGDKTVRLWSVQDGRSVRLLQGHHGSILAMAFSPNGEFLASAGEDRRIKIWDLSSGSLFKEFRGHSDTVYDLSFNQQSTLLASGGMDCCVRMWDVRKNREPKPESKMSSGIGEGHTSPELQGAFSTKSTSITFLQFTKNNLLQVAGSIL